MARLEHQSGQPRFPLPWFVLLVHMSFFNGNHFLFVHPRLLTRSIVVCGHLFLQSNPSFLTCYSNCGPGLGAFHDHALAILLQFLNMFVWLHIEQFRVGCLRLYYPLSDFDVCSQRSHIPVKETTLLLLFTDSICRCVAPLFQFAVLTFT